MGILGLGLVASSRLEPRRWPSGNYLANHWSSWRAGDETCDQCLGIRGQSRVRFLAAWRGHRSIRTLLKDDARFWELTLLKKVAQIAISVRASCKSLWNQSLSLLVPRWHSRANSLASNLWSLVSSCSPGKTTMNRILKRRYSGVSFNRRSNELFQDCDLIWNRRILSCFTPNIFRINKLILAIGSWLQAGPARPAKYSSS